MIGGGPAGATSAALLARRGHRVVLAEKDAHPRFHIGESLLPMNLPIFERLGVAREVARIGVKKRGADFTGEADGARYTTMHFRRALGDSPGFAYEVRRSELDALLFANAATAGATTLENTEVLDIAREGDGSFGVMLRDATGNELRHQTRFVVDASGRDTLLAGRRGWKRRNRAHASAALFGHFRGVARRPDSNQGNISIYWFEHGWIWMIPLPDGVMSVGAVCRPAYLKTRKGAPPLAFLRQTLARVPDAMARCGAFEPVEPVRVTGNYSYRAARMAGPGFVLVGDAYAFIDPVFSSGVYLAMHGAEQAIPQVEAWLAGDRNAHRRAVRDFQRSVRRGLSAFGWFIYRFNSPGMRRLFRRPRNRLRVEQAVISLLSGDVFRDNGVHRRLRLFHALYRVASMTTPGKSLKSWMQRKETVNHEFR